MSEVQETPPPPPARGVEGWLGQRERQVVWIMLAVALVLRLITLFELDGSPASALNDAPDSDMAYFNLWGQQLSRGDHLLSDGGSSHPLHRWHRQVGSEYLSVRPELLGGRGWNELEPFEQLNEEGKLWNGWYGGRTFHQEPLYPYLLAVVYGFFGDEESRQPGQGSPARKKWPVQVLQILVGVATIALLYLVTRIYFGRLVALIASGMVTLHAPLLHYEFFLLRAPLIGFAGLLLVYLGERLRSSPTPKRWLFFGVACGLSAALKASFGPFGLVMAVYLAWPRDGQRGLAGMRLGLWGLGAFLALLPVFLRNLVVGAPLLSITSIGPVTFAVANHADYVANTGWTPHAPVIAEIMGESGGGWFGTIRATLATHDSIGSYLDLLWAKFCQIWQWFEVPNNTSFYFVRKSSAVLSSLPVTFTVFAALALVGIGAALLRRRPAIPLLLLIGIGIVQMVGFYVLARFRLPMTLAMAPFSALGLVSLWEWLRQREFRRAAIGAGAALLFGWWMQRDLHPERYDISPGEHLNSGDYSYAHSRYYFPEWQQAINDGDLRRAEELLLHSIAIRPDYLDGIVEKASSVNSEQFTVTPEELQAVQIYRQTYGLYAETLKAMGDTNRETAIRKRAELLNAIALSVEPGRNR